MKVVNIDFENKTFLTEDWTEYPFIFNVNPSASFSGKYYGRRSLERRKKKYK